MVGITRNGWSAWTGLGGRDHRNTHTARHPDQRAIELSGSTGIPTPFVVRHFTEVKDIKAVEKNVHSVLSDCRVETNREFFSIGINEALDAIAPILGEYAVRRPHVPGRCSACGIQLDPSLDFHGPPS